MTIKELTEAIQGIEVAIPAAELERIAMLLSRYRELLLTWNARFNLTAITDEQAVLIRHFVDSLTVLKVLPSRPLSLLDVGTGPGFPGIPLKLARPELAVTVMDSTSKKVRFCAEVIQQLGLTGIRALHGRAEEMAHQPQFREQFDVVTARAVASLPTLVEYLMPFVKPGGLCIAMKGSDAENEAAQAMRAIGILGGRLSRVVPVQLPGLPDKRALIVIEKVSATPPLYPRQGGGPRTAPL
jgi:16S rRNA (guanine527-N7)-methyltransferase